MKCRLRIFFALSFLFTLIQGNAQVVDRYPVIQCPTETSALIAWRTVTAGTGTLYWGTDSLNLSQTQTGPATQKHAFTLTQLNPNTEYFYRVETSSGYSSATESFYTAKTIQEQTVTFLHYGDCGYNNTVQNGIAALMEQEEVDFAVVAGDVDQGDGSDYDDIFFGVYRNMLARDCHFTAIGNHDIIYDNGDTYLDAFYLPTNNQQQSERYYSFTWGNTKFICLDSNIDYSPGSDQHNFLLDELKCNDHQWLFVFFHHPPWTNAWDPSYYVPFQPYYEYDGNDDMRTDLVPYFEQYGVDFVLNGHSHCYQRGEMNGVKYVISGGAGTSTLDAKTCNTWPSFNGCAPNIQKEVYENHYVRFEVRGDTATYYALNASGQLIDSVSTVKSWTPYDAQITVTQPTPGLSDGAIGVSVTGPHPPYAINWSTGDTISSLTGLPAGNYVVTITNALGCERLDTIVLGNPVGIVLENPMGFRTWPNPFEESLRFQWQDWQEFELCLTDVNGRIIRREKGSGNALEWNTAGLPAGVYFYRWTAHERLITGKVICQ